ncbi:MAG: hypothetical protein ACTSP4_03385 [Candidatus Hodarchaeales archaeon]
MSFTTNELSMMIQEDLYREVRDLYIRMEQFKLQLRGLRNLRVANVPEIDGWLNMALFELVGRERQFNSLLENRKGSGISIRKIRNYINEKLKYLSKEQREIITSHLEDSANFLLNQYLKPLELDLNPDNRWTSIPELRDRINHFKQSFDMLSRAISQRVLGSHILEDTRIHSFQLEPVTGYRKLHLATESVLKDYLSAFGSEILYTPSRQPTLSIFSYDDYTFAHHWPVFSVPISHLTEIHHWITLAHEMGHYITKTTYSTTNKGSANRLITNVCDSLYLPSQWADIIIDDKSWAEEIFADLVGIKVGGPGFLFAMIHRYQPFQYLIQNDNGKFPLYRIFDHTSSPNYPPIQARLENLRMILRKDIQILREKRGLVLDSQVIDVINNFTKSSAFSDIYKENINKIQEFVDRFKNTRTEKHQYDRARHWLRLRAYHYSIFLRMTRNLSYCIWKGSVDVENGVRFNIPCKGLEDFIEPFGKKQYEILSTLLQQTNYLDKNQTDLDEFENLRPSVILNAIWFSKFIRKKPVSPEVIQKCIDHLSYWN